MARSALLVVMLAALAAAAAGPPSVEGAGRCPVTVPTRAIDPGGGFTAAAFNHGGTFLRAHLYWPRGVLRAGLLPDGGSLATVADDGSIDVKLGWWRGRPGRLAITGRRLDRAARPLHAHVPGGYGSRGFQPSGLRFPTAGCWRVTGRVADARLTFVVLVVKLPGAG